MRAFRNTWIVLVAGLLAMVLSLGAAVRGAYRDRIPSNTRMCRNTASLARAQIRTVLVSVSSLTICTL